MDNSVTRRGQPCWYRLPKVRSSPTACAAHERQARLFSLEGFETSDLSLQVGLVACNDYIILESCIYRILQRYFRTHPSYAQILDLFHEVSSTMHHRACLAACLRPNLKAAPHSMHLIPLSTLQADVSSEMRHA